MHVEYRSFQLSGSGDRIGPHRDQVRWQALLLICRTLWTEKLPVNDNAELAVGQRIKNFIDEHYKENLEFRLITAELKMNRFYLAHVFKAFSGYSPKQYQTRRRIGEAQSLLLSTSSGVTEFANAVGYDNVNNFHRIFQNLVGISPARYKKFWLTGELKSK
ncbi:helix-turn-helix transcriptional regulator [Erwinia sp. BNK-24-b]|uniref:helix-turn-helix transcriptional regulator n=1 Tax=unclassified Erwinia TaxID=2622719 RepID=UPI0039BF22FA